MPKLSTLVSVKKLFKDKAAKSKTVQLDGFRFEGMGAEGPYASQITGPIRSLWQEKMSRLIPELDLFECLHLIILQAVMDGSSPEAPLFSELSRACVSTAARFHALIEELRVMSATMGSLYRARMQQ
ncbi:uncharacterized protein LOC135476689 [Liolophura sinensis]|uniref:uncharacterized protein LOC135476689 n=1 Tax=Liolophura sinensis TaxID=3198878 RepID=UPI0031599040